MLLEFSPVVHDQVLVLGMMLQRRGCVLSQSLWGWFTSQDRSTGSKPTLCYTLQSARDNVPRPMWTHSKVTDSKKKTNSAGSARAWQIIRPSLSGFANRENATCLLTKSRSTNWWSNDPLQRAIVTFSVYDVNACKEGHQALHPCRLASFPGLHQRTWCLFMCMTSRVKRT